MMIATGLEQSFTGFVALEGSSKLMDAGMSNQSKSHVPESMQLTLTNFGIFSCTRACPTAATKC